MTVEEIVGLVLVLFIMLVGLAGSVLPGIPSTPLVFLAALGHRLYFGGAGASSWVLALMAGLVVLSLVMDYLASMVGARKLGATRAGIIGAVVGGLIGLFFSLPGILLGPFLGALAFELLQGRELPASARAGLGATLGLLAGAVGKLVCCTLMIGLFVVNVIARSGHLGPLEATVLFPSIIG